MNTKVIIFCFISSLFFSFESLAAKEQVKPLPIIQDIFTKAKSQNFRKNKKLQNQVSYYFDYEKMGLDILDQFAIKRNKKDVSWFQNIIKDIITKTVYPEAQDFLSKVKISHEISEQSKNSIQVLTLITKRGEETEVLSFFKKLKGKWRIVNISIDDESWVENIQTQVHKTIKEKGWTGLKKSLSKRLKELLQESKG